MGCLHDVHAVFERLRPACHPGTRILINWHSRVWQPLMMFGEKIGVRNPQPPLNWTTAEDVTTMLNLAGFDVVQHRRHILLPARIPLLTTLANRYLAHLPGYRSLCLTNWIVARPIGLPQESPPTVSIICPCRNEAGNINGIVERLPALGAHTELIFVEGHSQDETLEKCKEAAAA